MLAEIASRHRLPILGSALREIFGNLYLYTCNEFQDGMSALRSGRASIPGAIWEQWYKYILVGLR